MVMDEITNDPAYMGGDYKTEPLSGLRTAGDFLIIAGTTPLVAQKAYPTRDAADAYLKDAIGKDLTTLDANDLLYQVDASRNYDPSGKLGAIKAPLMWVNSADDFINPPELGIAEKMAPLIKHCKFVLIPTSDKTHGHGTHTWAAVWKDKLEELLKESE
jgi:homoserine O-acetyltransferase